LRVNPLLVLLMLCEVRGLPLAFVTKACLLALAGDAASSIEAPARRLKAREVTCRWMLQEILHLDLVRGPPPRRRRRV
jgi:hypothetical protein